MVYVDKFNEDIGDLHSGSRVCKACLKRFPMTDFFWAGRKQCRRRKCKRCVELDRKERHRDPAYAAKSKEAQRYSALRLKYGLSREDVARLEREAGGNCAICSRGFNGQYHVDHCHESGKVRGLLCFTCNTALGKFMDSVEILESAIRYLRKSEGEDDRMVNNA